MTGAEKSSPVQGSLTVQVEVGPERMCRWRARAQAPEGAHVGRDGVKQSETNGGDGYQAARVRVQNRPTRVFQRRAGLGPAPPLG